MKRLKLFLILYAIFIFAGLMRLYNVNWDAGFHMHPDERAIILSVINLSFPHSLSEFFSPKSPWNPHFFAYGSFPFYLLRIAGNLAGKFNPLLAQYDSINLVGRVLSAFFDLGTLFFVFLLGRKLFSQGAGLIAALLYAISTLPIQLSHFYAVDTILTFFITATLYYLLKHYERPTVKTALTIGLFFGFALATKISATVLLSAIGMALVIDFLLVFLRQPHRPHHYLPHLPKFFVKLIQDGLIIILTAVITFALLEPYAFIDFSTFRQQTIEQSNLTKDAFAFPYTLQYVGKVPYLYELKNVFFFGLGPLLAGLTFIGIILLTGYAIKKNKHEKWAQELILMTFFWIYFLIVCHFAVGFMRYMLPVYPLLCLSAAFVIFRLFSWLKHYASPSHLALCALPFALCLLLWPVSFLAIYMHPNTRVQATDWILSNIPIGKTLSIEHWDDALPISQQERYRMLTLTLYDEDTPQKWQTIDGQLGETDYIILASNRLYTPLMKLTDCQKLPVGRCYQQTASYYQRLFQGSLGFHKVAEFTDYPTVPFTDIKLNDQWADESFTVYDHPRILIYQKD